MPLGAGRAETRTMRYTMTVPLVALALLIPMTGSAAAQQRVLELTSAGTAQTLSFAGASADGSRVFIATSESLSIEDTDSVQDLYEFAGATVTLLSDRVQAGADEAKDVSFEHASAD